MLIAKVVASAVILALTALAAVYSGRMHEDDGKVTVAFFGTVMAALLWCPHRVAEWSVGAGFILLALAIAPRASTFGVAAGVVLVSWWLMPGGVLVGVEAFLAGVCVLALAAYRRTLLRMERGTRLVPGERPRGDVAVSGVALAGASLPHTGAPCAAWTATAQGEERRSQSPLVLRSDAGPITVLLDEADVELHLHRLTLAGDEAGAVARVAGLPADAASVEVRWIEPGEPVYVIGVPAWEPAQAEGAGYRDTALVPVFRKHEADAVYVADRSEADVRGATKASIAQCVALGLCFGGVAALQAMRML